jgi:hypothetical protein
MKMVEYIAFMGAVLGYPLAWWFEVAKSVEVKKTDTDALKAISDMYNTFISAQGANGWCREYREVSAVKRLLQIYSKAIQLKRRTKTHKDTDNFLVNGRRH